MLIWAIAALFLGVYNILQNINVSLIVQPQSFGFLVSLCWVQCLYYGDGPVNPHQEGKYPSDPKRKQRKPTSLKKTCAIFLGYIIFAVAFECGFVTILRSTAKGTPPHLSQAGVQFFGIMAATFISLGLL
jgi:hypothetical protein